MKNRLSDFAKEVFDTIEQQGGRVYIVGGAVRDEVMNKDDAKDIDVEVYHLDYDQLKAILSSFGEVNTYGRSFAIMGLSTLKGYDFALPRREIKTGEKHQDFAVSIEKDLALNKAVERRDLTMNALMYDYASDQIIDLVGGVDDIKKGIIRMVNPERFKEDPLRILRIAEFIARYEMTVDQATQDYCAMMVQEGMLESLSQERIYEAYKKILMAYHPSLGFMFLRDINALPFYLKDLVGCFQRLDFHPEGDVFTHTMMVVDLGRAYCEYSDDPEAFMFSCLLHDIGKPAVTTKEGRAPYHNEAGVEVFKKVDLLKSKKLRDYVETMIMYHMHLMNMSRNHSTNAKFLRLLKNIDGKVSIYDLMFMTICDKLGRGYVGWEQYDQFLSFMDTKLKKNGDKPPLPLINGQDLIDLGFTDHQQYHDLLDQAYDLQLQGLSQGKIVNRLKKELNNEQR